MKTLVLSDLHVEFSPFEADVEATQQSEVVVLAGDIHQSSMSLSWARQTFPNKEIVYVAENHKFYGEHWDMLLSQLRISAEINDIHF